jgi:hypothetical protein
MRVNRVEAARLLAELTRVGEIGKCRACRCYVDVLRRVREEILSRDLAGLPAAEALDRMIGRTQAEQLQGCAGCDPCLPVEPFNAFNELLEQAGAGVVPSSRAGWMKPPGRRRPDERGRFGR